MAASGMTGQGSSLKRRESTAATREGDQLIITPLGAGSEVGRSCVYMSYKGKIVLFDCGIHPAYSGMAALPYFDEIDPSTIDVLLVTHFHLDHAASLPYFLEKTTFKGRVFMTHATKAIYKLLLSDYVKVSKVSVEDMLYDEQDILRSMDKIEVIDFHQTLEVNGIRFWCYTAGHVLGAAMFMVDIAGVRVLYTGDYSREEDRHLLAAEIPQFSPDICIIESTYGVQLHQPRLAREKRFTEIIHSTVSQGGRVLIPAFALGRAQELLLILDEYWSNHPDLHNIPIYYASPLAKRCMAVYQTYINSMNERIRNQFAKSNPFDFKHISPLKSIENFNDVGPSVVMASPGSLQSGLSRQLFDKWCSDKKNACVLPGYVMEGTLAKTIINEPKEVTLMNGLTAPLNMQVYYISFSAHADFAQTSAFLNELMPPNIILVHGEANEMARLKQNLITQFTGTNTKIISPKNCQSVEMYFSSEKMAKTIGRLAEKVPDVGETVSGLLVKKGFTYQIMAPEDLHVFSQLSTANITQRISVPYSGSFEVIKYRLKQIYESVESPSQEADAPTLVVHERVTIKQESENYVTMQWSSDPISDMVSDSVVAMILNINREGPKVTPVEEATRTQEETEKMAHKVIYALMVSLFGDVKVAEEGKLVITVDGDVAQLNGKNGEVECENEGLKERVRMAFRRIQGAVRPIPLTA
ncbi:cleavage and polyadenylation specificity factor subunit 3-I-like [Ananas comosus]|uniref:Cleavage and polyadenylation specificity factor subunit 3-I n=1 Tax=Ananas comosus TaxID=4615 RepID=A0A199W0P6_ANACO|nr:cleavage and polyadenylation specificity factor subunit 3-I-like [Ananas comosus]XP_020084340.1 cleavage and polyadenylation specificity factor subunit 3-I-like [Ananas comosus]OAY82816.1 Cleavage and polyadenylation specificity factor subunit 3-I [Ananas comosus]